MSHVVSQRIQKICLFFNIFKPWCALLTCSDRILRDVDFGWLWMTLANPAQTHTSESLVFQKIAHVSAAWAAEAELRCTRPLPKATRRWWSSWWRWRRWRCKTNGAGGLSWRVAVDLWPWCFVVGFTCWQARIQDADHQIRCFHTLYLVGFAIFSRHVSTWVSMNPIIGFFNRFSNYSGNLEKHQLLRVSFVLNKFGLSVCRLNLKHVKNSSETDRTTTDEISRNGPWWIFLNS